jgi:DNA (cytosine-5)-methyltransferase 1
MVAEPQIINPLKGESDNGWHFEQQVYDAEGIARAVKAGEGSGNIPKVIEPNVLTPKRTEFGKAIRKKYESHEIEMSRHDMTTMESRTDGVSNTLTSVQKDNLLAEPKIVEDWQTVVGNKQLNPFRGSVEGTSPCITSAWGAGGGMTPMLTDANLETTKTKEFIEQVRGHEEMRYRIRKLTPRECFRLMGVDDADIDKLMSAGISNSQLYKCAGNSIVVDTLYHLFRKMYIDKGCELENYQPTLF